MQTINVMGKPFAGNLKSVQEIKGLNTKQVIELPYCDHMKWYKFTKQSKAYKLIIFAYITQIRDDCNNIGGFMYLTICRFFLLTLPILRCLVISPYTGVGGGVCAEPILPCDLKNPIPQRLEIL